MKNKNVKFNQEFFDKVMNDLDNNKIEIKDNLKFEQFPPGIKKYITIYIIAIITTLIIWLYFIIKIIKQPSLKSILKTTLFFGAITFFLILKARLLYVHAAAENFYTFSGVVIDAQSKGFLQTSKYKLVKLTDGDKIINFKYTGNKKISKGLPITIYIDSNSIISETEEGLLAERVIGVEFTDKEADKEMIKDNTKEQIVAEDLFED